MNFCPLSCPLFFDNWDRLVAAKLVNRTSAVHQVSCLARATALWWPWCWWPASLCASSPTASIRRNHGFVWVALVVLPYEKYEAIENRILDVFLRSWFPGWHWYVFWGFSCHTLSFYKKNIKLNSVFFFVCHSLRVIGTQFAPSKSTYVFFSGTLQLHPGGPITLAHCGIDWHHPANEPAYSLHLGCGA